MQSFVYTTKGLIRGNCLEKRFVLKLKMRGFHVLQLKVYDWSKLGTCLYNGNWVRFLRIRLKIFGES
jgi:hypothetical protein